VKGERSLVTKEEAARLARLFAEIAEVFESVSARDDGPQAAGSDSELVAALTALPAKYQRVVALISHGEPGSLVASNGASKGEGRWLGIMEATEGVAKVIRGGKRVITTIAGANPALSGITYVDEEEEAFVPDDVAAVARRLWPSVADEKLEAIFEGL
jgi:hypothetical protein